MKAYQILIFLFFISKSLSAQTSNLQKDHIKGEWKIVNIRDIMTDTLVLKKVSQKITSEYLKFTFYENGSMERFMWEPKRYCQGFVDRKEHGNWELNLSELTTTIPILGIRKKHKVVKLTNEEMILVQLN